MRKFIVLLALILVACAGLSADQNFGSRVNIRGDVVVKEGETVKNATAVMGNVAVNGTVEGNAVAVLGAVELGPKGIIKGDATAIHGVVKLSDGSKVFGNITEIGGWKSLRHPLSLLGAGFLGILWLLRILILIGTLAFGALFAALFPKYCSDVSKVIDNSILKTFLWGVLFSILILPVTLVLLFTIVGILFIPLEIVLLLLAAFAGYLVAGQFCGKKLIEAAGKTSSSPLWQMLLGLLVLWLAMLVPLLGIAVKVFAVTLGFGAVLLSIFKLREKNENPN